MTDYGGGRSAVDVGRSIVRRFTRAKIEEALRLWPQAVSADQGDLRVLLDMAAQGHKVWGQKFRRPDYLWFDLAHEFRPTMVSPAQRTVIAVAAPEGTSDDAIFAFNQRAHQPAYPPDGVYAMSNTVSCIIELKVVEADVGRKLTSYRSAGLAWPEFLNSKLHQSFFRRMKDADEQIRDGRKLFGSSTRGVVVVVNEGSPGINALMVAAYLSQTMRGLPNIDAIIYLSDSNEKRSTVRLMFKRGDTVIANFYTQFSMMLESLDLSGPKPVLRSGDVYPEFLVRIEMDAKNRAMCANWSAGWRRVDDPTPVPSLSMKVSLVPRADFVSGL